MSRTIPAASATALQEGWNRFLLSPTYEALPDWLQIELILHPVRTLTVFAAVVLIGPWIVLTVVRRLRRGSDQRRAARALERSGSWLEAGRRWQMIGRNRRALRCFRRESSSEGDAAAIRLLAATGGEVRALEMALASESWSLVAELATGLGEHDRAGDAWQRLDRPSMAADAYRKAGLHRAAFECFCEAGLGHRAAELLQDDRPHGKAAPEEHHQEHGDQHADQEVPAPLMERAVRLELARGDLSPAMARFARRAGQALIADGANDRAFRLLRDCGLHADAALLCRDLVEPGPEAVEVCREAGDLLLAARLLDRLGQEQEAELARAEHHHRNDQIEKAAEHYARAGETEQAAELYAACGKTDLSAQLYERSGDFATAAVLYSELGEHERSQELRQRAESLDLALHSVPTEPDPSQTVPGAVGERYRLGEEVGRGGMGLVYRGFDTTLQRPVAIKLLHVSDHLDELLDEARAVASLSHPHIVSIFDAGRGGPGAVSPAFHRGYIVMEWLDGPTLSAVLAQDRPPMGTALDWARQMLLALEHAHDRGMVHRDLKPANLLFVEPFAGDGDSGSTASREEGSTPERGTGASTGHLKLVDFGLARRTREGEPLHTRPAGTPAYMAPEHIRGQAIGRAADLYSFGCVLFRLLTGQRPFPPNTTFEDVLLRQAPDPRGLCPDLDRRLAELTLLCLRKSPEERPTAHEARRRLEEAASDLA